MKRRETYLYYLMAVLVCALLITGLVYVLQGGGKKTAKKEAVKKEAVQKEAVQKEAEQKPETKPEGTSASGENIRVLLLSSGYRNPAHPEVTLSSEDGLLIAYGEETEEWQSADIMSIKPDDERFQKGNLRITPLNGEREIKVHNIERGYGTPSYKGTLELQTSAEGIVLVNDLPVEDYLCRVVPSEMPASFEPEALKAQAVCARSYAFRQMEDYGYPEYKAHVNDSTDYQVYNNSQPAVSAEQAVRETEGQEVWYQGQAAVTYYYSTSCGRTTGMEAWGTETNEGNAYLQSVAVSGEDGDYEKDLPWYRWSVTVPVKILSNLVGINTGVDVGTLASVEVTKRGPGDVALQITATGDKGSVTVDTENKIRTALGGSGYTITKNDGTVVDSTRLLPSAFFTIERQGDAFVIQGGGFGHGIGMSQNGANEMAKQGKSYREILSLFYPGTTVE